MRTTVIVGLNERGLAYIAGDKILLYTDYTRRVFPDGSADELPPCATYGSNVKIELSGEYYTGMCHEQFLLRKFTLPDGTVYFERLQADPWDAGSHVFYALQRGDGTWLADSLWTNSEIESALGNESPIEEVDESAASG